MVDETPAPPVVAVSGGCESYRPLIQQYNWDVRVAMAVMQAESGCDPTAANLNDRHSGCVGSYGLMQIACIHTGGAAEHDPARNIAAAWMVYEDRGKWDTDSWNAWGVYTSGRYLKYLE